MILKKKLDDKGFYTNISAGYMFYESWINGKPPSFYLRRGLIIAQKTINKSIQSYLKSSVKYSILIPTYNGINYLPSCVSSIISQDYTDYELIISDDHSTDGTKDYLNTINHPNITVLHTPVKMSMTEHWEWALDHARGDWCIFVGQDDGLQAYFFTLVDFLTDIAKKNNLRTISSKRAYYFWPGCKDVHGTSHIIFKIANKINIYYSKLQMIETLTKTYDYFELPQMYTTSLFHKSILNKARKLQNGTVFVTHPQDANLAAISCSLERRYLYSNIPFGWVGTSPKSAGLAVSSNINKDLRREYNNKIRNSGLHYCSKIGDFGIASYVLYFWGALIETTKLQNHFFHKFIASRFFTYLVISCAKIEMEHSQRNHTGSITEIKKINSLNELLFILSYKLVRFYLKIVRLFCRIKNKIILVFNKEVQQDDISLCYCQAEQRSMSDISEEVRKLFVEKKVIESLKKRHG
jgi:glycosyltransferase involved in cell wall biosynthesis